MYALDLTRYLKYGTAMASKTESDFNSVERVVQYLQVWPGLVETSLNELLNLSFVVNESLLFEELLVGALNVL